MKWTLERDALHAALNRVARIVERRSTIPILTHLHLQAKGSEIALRATDLDIEASTGVPADVAQAGRTTAPAHLLAEVVAKIPSGAQMRFEVEGTRLIIKTGRSRTTLNILPPEDFPDTGARTATHEFLIEPAALTAMIDKTAFAISTEETRYYLNGIFLHAHTEDRPVLRAVATDGHRLARFEVPLPEGAAGMPGIIVPRKTIGEMKRLAKDATGPIGFALGDGRLTVTIAGKQATTVLASKLIDGTFPDYQRIIPRGNDKRAGIDRQGCLAAAERVACISSERGRAVKLAFADDRLVLRASTPDAGDAADEVDVSYDAAPVEIGFNAAYLGECLATLSGDTVDLDLDSPGAPALFRERGSDAFLVILMPMRV